MATRPRIRDDARAVQIDLFEHVASAYTQANDGRLSNARLYQAVAEHAGVAPDAMELRVPIGRRQDQRHSLIKRKIRWYQQTLKRLGVLEHSPGERGVWRLTESGDKQLRRAPPKVSLLAFSTDLGIALWGACEDVFTKLDLPIALCLTSPPFPLRKPRAYGNPTEIEYIDFICRALEPIVARLVPGGSICLNVSNDIFLQGSPGRSLYRERMVIALCERLGLTKMDELVWLNPSKPPAPVQWASVRRVQLNVAWEPVYWFTNDASLVRADNRRVLQPHSKRHLRLIESGGEQRTASYCDGAYRLRNGSFGGATRGRIARNLLVHSHSCADQKLYKARARGLGLPAHGAAMPLSLAKFLIDFLTQSATDLVADPFGGSCTTAKAAETLGRRWITTETVLAYVRGSAERFRSARGFWLNPELCLDDSESIHR
jgi:DNA modification methylase